MKAVVFLADGFEECEALIVVDILHRAGIETVMASVMGRPAVDSSRHIKVLADALAEDVDFLNTDLIVLPGGRLGTENLAKSTLVRARKEATCHPDFTSSMKEAVLREEPVVVSGNLTTGQGLGAAFPFAFELVKQLAGEEKVQQIKAAICYKQ